VHETESTPLTGWMWLARVMTAVQRVCYALEAAVRSPLLFRFRAGFHCQIVDVVGRSHSRRNQGAAAVLAPEKTPVFSSPAVSSLRASSPLKKLQFALNGHGPPSCDCTKNSTNKRLAIKSEPQLVRFSDSSAHQQPLSEKFDADLATPRHVSDPGKHSAKTLFLWIWGGS
jgi:hypothetical protein